jgi:hypothetical protein
LVSVGITNVGMLQSEVNSRSYSIFHLGVLACLCVAEILSLAAIATLYRAMGKPDMTSFLWSRPGLLFMCLVAGIVVSLCGVVYQTFKARKHNFGRCRRTVVVNVVAFVGVLILGEVGVRASVTESLRGPVLGGVELRPYVWTEIADRFAKRAEEQRNEQFFVFDSLLGWTVKPNSTGERGLFQSSAEGIRIPRAGIEYANANPGCRIALVGDSFVFGEESEFEKTWGHQLERSLGNRCQVLNFGVPGYGVGQMYLRYNKDVSPLHPDIVIVGFTDTVVFRTLGVYGCLTFSGYIPGPIPRYVLENGLLKLINIPLIRPDAIYSTPSVEDLPYIRYAWNYAPNEWELPGWQQLSRSYLFRTYVTLFPLWPQPRPEVSGEEVNTVNAELFKSIQDNVRANGAIPLLVYFPNKDDYRVPSSLPPVVQVMRKNGLEFVDLTPCLDRVDPQKRFLVNGSHYTSEGESAVAECLGPFIRQYVTRANTRRTSADGGAHEEEA